MSHSIPFVYSSTLIFIVLFTFHHRSPTRYKPTFGFWAISAYTVQQISILVQVEEFCRITKSRNFGTNFAIKKKHKYNISSPSPLCATWQAAPSMTLHVLSKAVAQMYADVARASAESAHSTAVEDLVRQFVGGGTRCHLAGHRPST